MASLHNNQMSICREYMLTCRPKSPKSQDELTLIFSLDHNARQMNKGAQISMNHKLESYEHETAHLFPVQQNHP